MRTPKGPQSPSSLQRGTLPCCPCRAPGCRGCCAQSRSGPVMGAAAPSEVANSEHGGSSGQGRVGYEPPPHHRKSLDTATLFARVPAPPECTPGVNRVRVAQPHGAVSISWCSRPALVDPRPPRNQSDRGGCPGGLGCHGAVCVGGAG